MNARATGTDIFCPGFFKQCDPLCCIKFFCFETENKIFVPKCVLASESRNMMFEFFTILLIHFAGIPLRTKCRYWIDSPVYEDAKLRIPEPVGLCIFFQRFPMLEIVPETTIKRNWQKDDCKKVLDNRFAEKKDLKMALLFMCRCLGIQYNWKNYLHERFTLNALS